MDKKWLLASVMLAALSLSGCDNTPGTHANNSGSAKSGSQAAGETHTAATSGTQQPAATAGTQAVQPAASGEQYDCALRTGNAVDRQPGKYVGREQRGKYLGRDQDGANRNRPADGGDSRCGNRRRDRMLC